VNKIKKELMKTFNGSIFIAKNGTVHSLKTIQSQFERTWYRQKVFEIRYDDRHYKRGDILILRETFNGKYTGRKIHAIVLYTLKNFKGIEEGYIILSILICKLIEA
jgi:hypothetical protein